MQYLLFTVNLVKPFKHRHRVTAAKTSQNIATPEIYRSPPRQGQNRKTNGVKVALQDQGDTLAIGTVKTS